MTLQETHNNNKGDISATEMEDIPDMTDNETEEEIQLPLVDFSYASSKSYRQQQQIMCLHTNFFYKNNWLRKIAIVFCAKTQFVTHAQKKCKNWK